MNLMELNPFLGRHASEETAFVVDDYPYGYRQRTSIRYWMEHDTKRGWRMASQTRNPKTGRWNAPKRGTYQLLAGVLVRDSDNRITWVGLNEYSSAEHVASFVDRFAVVLDVPCRQGLKAWCLLKVRFYEKLLAGEATFTLNGVAQPRSDEERARDAREASAWRAALESLRSCSEHDDCIDHYDLGRACAST